LKELRIQSKQKVLRIFFIFDSERKAILLIGGNKRGNKRFYQKFIPMADALYDDYLVRKGNRR